MKVELKMCQLNEMLGKLRMNGKMPMTLLCVYTHFVSLLLYNWKKILYNWMKMCGWTEDEYEEVYEIAHQWIGQNGKQMDKLNAKLLFDGETTPLLKCVIA